MSPNTAMHLGGVDWWMMGFLTWQSGRWERSWEHGRVFFSCDTLVRFQPVGPVCYMRLSAR